MEYGKNTLAMGAVFMGVAVGLGAIGAHLLKAQLDINKMSVFQVGVEYHMYHGLGLMLLGCLELHLNKRFSVVKILFVFGILFFSGNCYLYAVTQIKIFATLIPLGGVSFIGAWFLFAWQVLRKRL